MSKLSEKQREKLIDEMLTNIPYQGMVQQVTKKAEPEAEKKVEVTLGRGVFGKSINMQFPSKVRQLSPLLPDGHLSISICGRSGCGKSTLLREIIPNIAELGYVVVCSLIVGNPLYQFIESYCDHEKIKYQFYSDPLEAQTGIEQLIAERSQEKNPKYGIIIMDDFNQGSRSRDNPFTRIQMMVSSMLRNLGFHSAFVSQDPTNIPTLVRTNANCRFIFGLNNTHGIRSITNDFVNITGRSKEEFQQLYNIVSKQIHSYIYIKDDEVYVKIGDSEHLQKVE